MEHLFHLTLANDETTIPTPQPSVSRSIVAGMVVSDCQLQGARGHGLTGSRISVIALSMPMYSHMPTGGATRAVVRL